MNKLTYTVEVELNDEDGDGFWNAEDVKRELDARLEKLYKHGMILNNWSVAGGTK